MKCDKDKPWTWIKYKNGMCADCYGTCCTMPVEVTGEDLVRLNLTTSDELEVSPKKVAKNLIKKGFVQSFRDGSGLFMLSARPNGDCVFLNEKSRLCNEYEKRPEVCRRFPEVGPRVTYCPYVKKGK